MLCRFSIGFFICGKNCASFVVFEGIFVRLHDGFCKPGHVYYNMFVFAILDKMGEFYFYEGDYITISISLCMRHINGTFDRHYSVSLVI